MKSRLPFAYSIGAVIKNSVQIEGVHFRSDLSRPEAVGLFQRHVEMVEVETTSYCNRTCSFCPNSFIDRRSETKTMPEAAWRAVLDGLREVDYDGVFVWSRYSEPLSERRIIDRIKEVRGAAPKSRICINSNGDYLDSDYLNALTSAGLDRLFIDIYIPDDQTYDLKVAETYHTKFLERIQRSCTVLATFPELTCRVDTPGLETTTHVRNVAVLKANDMSDRGGLIEIARRTRRVAPCYAPYKHLVLDWDGSIVICCQLRSDSPEHKMGIVGRVGIDGVGLVDAYTRLSEWRYSLRTYGPKDGPCATCNVYEYASNAATIAISRRLVNTEGPTSAVRSILRTMFPKKLRY